VIDGNGHPLNMTLSAANRHDTTQLLETIDGIHIGKRRRRPKRLELDKDFDSEIHRRALRQRRIIPIVPFRKNHVSKSPGVRPKMLFKRSIAINAGRLNALSVGSTTIADLIDSLSLDKILIWLLYPSFSSNIIWMSCFQASNDF
jgi:hypothetical protein